MKKTLTLFAHVEDDDFLSSSSVNEFETSLKHWRLPDHPSNQNKTNVNKKANKYLKYQWSRLQTMIYNGEITKACEIFSKLAQRSNTLLAYWINKISRGWYQNCSDETLKKLIKKIRKITKNSSSSLDSQRFYIPKPNGKLRPIGAPALEWRVIIGMWTGFLYMCLDQTISNNQYGFRPGRSLLETWKKIWRRADDIGLNKLQVAEFDLESFFNLVSTRTVETELKSRGLPNWLVNWINWVNSNPPRFNINEIQPEKELEYNPEGKWLFKRGLPQGLAWSPLLAILVLDATFKKLGINAIMYADDGVIVSDTTEEFEKLQNNIFELGLAGIKVSKKQTKSGKEATRLIDDNLLTFVGLSWDFDRDEIILSSGERIPRKLANDKQILKLIWQGYEQNKDWRWNIERNSWLQRYMFTECLPEQSYLATVNLSRIAQDISYQDAFNNKGSKNAQIWLSSAAQPYLLDTLKKKVGKSGDQLEMRKKYSDSTWGVTRKLYIDMHIEEEIPVLKRIRYPLNKYDSKFQDELNTRWNKNRAYFGENMVIPYDEYVWLYYEMLEIS